MPRGIACGATRADGAEGAESAQNQPISNYYCEGLKEEKLEAKGIRLKKVRRGGGDCPGQIRAGSIVIAPRSSAALRLAVHINASERSIRLGLAITLMSRYRRSCTQEIDICFTRGFF
jgi:hypothetical protein